jgi:ParB family transcriptional regulator, chromosome partitioning protein
VDDPAAGGMRAASPSQELRELPLDMIEPNLAQPRRYFEEAALEALATSIGERGVLQPVLVRPLKDGRYQLVAGERRWRAAKTAGLQTIPALVSAYDDLAALEVGLIENMAREDLNPVEEARACVTLVRELGLTHRQIALRVGRGHVTVWNLMRLLDLSAEIVELLERGELSKSHGTALLVAKDPQVRSRLAREAIERGWSTRTLEARARESNMDGPKSREGPEEVGLGWEKEKGKEGDAGQAHEQEWDTGQAQQDLTVMNVARVWGDVLGVEVGVRTLRARKLRLEVVFNSAEAALAVGGRLGDAVARGSKRR